MEASAIFGEGRPGGRRVTVLLERADCLTVVAATLGEVGLSLESVEPGVDTVWDVAATGPDLVILAVEPARRAGAASELAAALRAHPRLRSVPMALCDPGGLSPVAMAPPDRAAVGIDDRPAESADVRALLAQLLGR
jgi:hypothetical protein